MGMWFPVAREAALLKLELVIETKYSTKYHPSILKYFQVFPKYSPNLYSHIFLQYSRPINL